MLASMRSRNRPSRPSGTAYNSLTSLPTFFPGLMRQQRSQRGGPTCSFAARLPSSSSYARHTRHRKLHRFLYDLQQLGECSCGFSAGQIALLASGHARRHGTCSAVICLRKRADAAGKAHHLKRQRGRKKPAAAFMPRKYQETRHKQNKTNRV